MEGQASSTSKHPFPTVFASTVLRVAQQELNEARGLQLHSRSRRVDDCLGDKRSRARRYGKGHYGGAHDN